MIFRALSLATKSLYHRTTTTLGALFRQPQLQLAGTMPSSAAPTTAAPTTASTFLDDLVAIWFAVPKQKVSRHKKRFKTTLQNRIKLRNDIVVDGRTGETTLRHKMPFNWKDYLPKLY